MELVGIVLSLIGWLLGIVLVATSLFHIYK